MRKAVLATIVAVAALSLVTVIMMSRRPEALRIDEVLAIYQENADYGGLDILYPADGTLFPPEMVPPTVRWQDSNPRSNAWLVRIEFGDGSGPIQALSRDPQWTPTSQEWETIKKQSTSDEARLVVLGLCDSEPTEIRSGARIAMATSTDPVGAPLFYREVNLPFIDAVKDPSRIRWRFGSIATTTAPPVVLENLPVCGNCHSFCRDGRTLAMDIDYANSKGSYITSRVKEEMILATSDVMTWNDYHKEDGEQTFGLLSQISPDGRYVLSTVKDKSVFVPKPDLAFSQLFFPIKGILCLYDRDCQKFRALPGANDPAFVQSNPTWSPDGKTVVFARSVAYDLKHTSGQGKVLLTREECKEFVEDGKPFLFDLYRIPFNDGRGGTAEPLEGASNNGMSNFFARYSPDGQWIVFCKAKSYMLLQPDSELYIIPAQGGTARRLQANTSRMNSWHSFSPNGRWLVFASKAYSDYTQLCLTHIDEHGHSTPAVLLAHLTAPDRAANIPEFVNATPQAIRKIREHFLNDYSFVRAGNAFFRQRDPAPAITEYRTALELNPDNAEAHHKLGFLLYNVKGKPKEGLDHLSKAIALVPRDPRVHFDLGMALLHQAQFREAAGHLSEAVQLRPDGIDKQYNAARMHFQLGRALLLGGQAEPALAPLSKALTYDPNHARAHYCLALARADGGRLAESLQHYARALEIQPEVDTSPILHHLLAAGYQQERQFAKALHHEEKAYGLAQAQGDPVLTGEIKKQVDRYRAIINAQRN
jgi:tetratricopeptide (TPR) repeat protein